jgi:hypothetical protein
LTRHHTTYFTHGTFFDAPQKGHQFVFQLVFVDVYGRGRSSSVPGFAHDRVASSLRDTHKKSKKMVHFLVQGVDVCVYATYHRGTSTRVIRRGATRLSGACQAVMGGTGRLSWSCLTSHGVLSAGSDLSISNFDRLEGAPMGGISAFLAG